MPLYFLCAFFLPIWALSTPTPTLTLTCFCEERLSLTLFPETYSLSFSLYLSISVPPLFGVWDGEGGFRADHFFSLFFHPREFQYNTEHPLPFFFVSICTLCLPRDPLWRLSSLLTIISLRPLKGLRIRDVCCGSGR
jgi:hypothetical protein